jgi:hypothetical protein
MRSSPVVGRSLDLLNQHARFECRIRSMVAEVLGAIVQGAPRPSSRRLSSVETRAFAFRSFGQELNRSDWYYAQNSIRGTGGTRSQSHRRHHRQPECGASPDHARAGRRRSRPRIRQGDRIQTAAAFRSGIGAAVDFDDGHAQIGFSLARDLDLAAQMLELQFASSESHQIKELMIPMIATSAAVTDVASAVTLAISVWANWSAAVPYCMLCAANVCVRKSATVALFASTA